MLHVKQKLAMWHLTPEGKQYEPLSFVTYTTLVGSERNNPCIAAKGMQSRTLFMFSAWLLEKRLQGLWGVLEGEANNFQTAQGLLMSSQYLKAWYTLVFKYPTHVPTQEAARILAFAKKHVALWRVHSGNTEKPKHHALICMSKSVPRSGGPACHNNYIDESLTSMMAILARSVHLRNFAFEVLKKYIAGRVLNKLFF